MKPRLRINPSVQRGIKRHRNRVGIPIKALLGNGNGQVYSTSARTSTISGDSSYSGKVPIRLLNGGIDANGQVLAGLTTWAWMKGLSIPMLDNLPIEVTQDEAGEYTISGIDAKASAQAGVNTVVFNPADPRNKQIWLRDILNAQAIAPADQDNDSYLVTSHPYLLIINGVVKNIGVGLTDALDLSGAVPSTAGKERLVLVYYDTTLEALGYEQGTQRDISTTKWTLADLNELVALVDLSYQIPLYTFRLYNGMFSITESDKRHDLRQFINAPIAGATGEPSLYRGYATKTANYTIVTTDGTIGVNASGGAITITLPTAVGLSGRSFNIKALDVSGGNVTIATTSSQTIDGVTTQTISTQYDSVTVLSDNANWLII